MKQKKKHKNIKITKKKNILKYKTKDNNYENIL